MHLLPSVEAATEAHCAHLVGPGVVHIVEEHLVPALSSSESERHDSVEARPCAIWVLCQEVVPWKRMVEVCDQHPCEAVSAAGGTGDGKHKPPALHRIHVVDEAAESPDARPAEEHEGVVLDAPREPLLVELLVAFATTCLVRKMHPPFTGKHEACIIEAEEVEDWNQGHREEQAPSSIPLAARSYLLKPVLKLFRIPTEFALFQEVNRAGMMPIVLENELLPWQRNEISKRMCEELLKLVRRESCAMHHIVINVDVLD
mmetsp:Transcript_7235/g.13049  ORF Transcript_7235/g.13049 Transcript_7235/m.13049 type:complete len:259 (-) Transcript_7235:576-1352(-)